MFLNLLAYLVIPVYTFFFTLGSDWFTSNFSVIGNTIGRKGAFIIWGIIVAVYYGIVTSRLIKGFRKANFLKPVIPSALLLLFFAVTTPYLPNELPFKSFLHIVFAFVSSVLLLLFLLIFTYKLSKEDKKYQKYFYSVIAIILISIFLLILAGIISSALELFFTFTTVLLCQAMLHEFERREELKCN
ncbi:MAG: hypothetical protein Q4B86_04980 [Eubacteriales bacterium]|nr:hypothetical protein [Eubacteriales bacterium]